MTARYSSRSFVKLLASKKAAPTLRRYASQQAYEHLLVSTPKPGVALCKCFFCRLIHEANRLVTFNRPKALNAMNSALMGEINSALASIEKDNSVGATVITGSEKSFIAGADIKQMKDLTFSDAYGGDFIESWSQYLAQAKKPIIAAVNGYALGGGCEIAMMADILYCSTGATFGQPEIKLGVTPGAGGSQRLTRIIGKSRAMDLILTGKNFSGKEAYEWGVAARVFENAQECVDGAVDTAALIASYSRVAVKACKEVVNKSQDLPLRDGLEFERRIFHGLFGSKDQKIGMAAFAEKRKPDWEHQ